MTTLEHIAAETLALQIEEAQFRQQKHIERWLENRLRACQTSQAPTVKTTDEDRAQPLNKNAQR